MPSRKVFSDIGQLVLLDSAHIIGFWCLCFDSLQNLMISLISKHKMYLSNTAPKNHSATSPETSSCCLAFRALEVSVYTIKVEK